MSNLDKYVAHEHNKDPSDNSPASSLSSLPTSLREIEPPKGRS